MFSQSRSMSSIHNASLRESLFSSSHDSNALAHSLDATQRTVDVELSPSFEPTHASNASSMDLFDLDDSFSSFSSSFDSSSSSESSSQSHGSVMARLSHFMPTISPLLSSQRMSPSSSSSSSASSSSSSSSSFTSLRSLWTTRLAPPSIVLNFMTTNATACFLSFISFRNFAVLSYAMLCIHFLILYLNAFFLYLSFTLDDERLTADASFQRTSSSYAYELLAVFYCARSTLLIAMEIVRMKRANLWWHQMSNPLSRAFRTAQVVERISTLVALVTGLVFYCVVSPPSDDASIFIRTPFFFVCWTRDLASLLAPLFVGVVLALRSTSRVRDLNFMMPYVAPFDLEQYSIEHLVTPKMPSSGLSEQALAELPIEIMGARNRRREGEEAGEEEEEEQPTCAICLNDLEANDQIYRIRCAHSFHVDCLKHWLKKRDSCPLCVAQCSPHAPSSASSSSSSSSEQELPALLI